jgi:hypothetical protein
MRPGKYKRKILIVGALVVVAGIVAACSKSKYLKPIATANVISADEVFDLSAPAMNTPMAKWVRCIVWTGGIQKNYSFERSVKVCKQWEDEFKSHVIKTSTDGQGQMTATVMLKYMKPELDRIIRTNRAKHLGEQ